MESQSDVTLDNNSFHAARDILAAPPLFIRFPGTLEQGFLQARQNEFDRFIGIGAPLAFLVCLLTVIGGHQAFPIEIYGDAARLWHQSAVGHGVMISGLAIAFLLPAVRHQYVFWLGLAGLSLTTSVMYFSIRLGGTLPGQSLTYIFMLIVTLIALSMRLSLKIAALATLGGGILGIGLAVIQGSDPNWKMLIHYYPGGVLVVLFIAWLLERQERISFLNAMLLAHESAERERLNQELEQLARQDALTGLANRRTFDDRLCNEWERSRRERQPLALLFIDIDHFKEFNDTYGHDHGDRCLADIANAIADSLLRPGDLAARYGGEEFVALLPITNTQGAEEVAQRIIDAVDELGIPHAGSSTTDHVTLSIGVCACIPESGLPAKLLKTADEALYKAKEQGRHQIHIQALQQ